MKPFKMRLLAVLLTALLLLPALLPGARALAQAVGEALLRAGDEYLSFSVNPSGSFELKTVGGAPRRQGDENAALLHESYASFRIGGQDYIFGKAFSGGEGAGRFLQEPKKTGEQILARWQAGGVEITQVLQLVGGAEPMAGNLHIRYQVKNTTGQPVPVGGRLLLDTALGASDCAPLHIPGAGGASRKRWSWHPCPAPSGCKGKRAIFPPGANSWATPARMA